MSNVMKRLDALLGTDVFKALQNVDVIDIAQLNAIIALLIKLNIPFEFIFNQGTPTNVPNAEITIPLSPTTEITIVLPFEKGPT